MTELGTMDIRDILTNDFDGIIEISSINHIDQKGLYLLYDGADAESAMKTKDRFKIIVAENTMNKDSGSGMAVILGIKNRVIGLSRPYAQHWFKSIKQAEFVGGSLYLYILTLEATTSNNLCKEQ